MTISAKVILDSIAPSDKRITTFVLKYPRFVHQELLTHRNFCLAGDAELEFELPVGCYKTGTRRVYKIKLEDFVNKWIYGSKPHLNRWGTVRRYGLKSRLQKMKIRQLDEATGDIIVSSVSDAVFSGNKPVFEITAGKYKIAGSEDHRVMTSDGWKRIAELNIGDNLVVRTVKKPDELKRDATRLKFIDGVWRSKWQIKQGEKLNEQDPMCRKCLTQLGACVHHIIPVHAAPERAFDDTNVTWLCESCHTDVHRIQGWQEGNSLYSGTASIESIKFRGIEKTYDLSIKGAFPNFIANGVVVHNSRNSASSRAIPYQRMKESIINDTAMPIYYGKNRPGMSASEELSAFERAKNKVLIDMLLKEVLGFTDSMYETGLHKQTVNRYLEPFMHMEIVCTATEWDNFYALRNHPDAQPEIQELAKVMLEAHNASNPTSLDVGQWHLPFIKPGELDTHGLEICQKISVARCGRVSYLNHEGKATTVEEDTNLYKKMIESKPMHASAAEHQAMALTDGTYRSGNFIGWEQYRKTLDNEYNPYYGGLLKKRYEK